MLNNKELHVYTDHVVLLS